MVKIVSACLFLALGLWGCDDGGGKRGEACIGFIGDQLPDNFLFQFEDCPTEGLLQVCNHYSCILDNRSIPDRQIDPQDCQAIDCFNMDCDVFVDFTTPAGSGRFTIDQILSGGDFQGTVSIEEGDFDYICLPGIP